MESLFILNGFGDIIIEKHYRSLISRTICDTFWEEVTKAKGAEVLPVISTPKQFLIHIKVEGLYFLGVVSQEISPLMVLEFLQRINEIFTQYFEKVTETSIRSNFVAVYQLLDEMMDNGYPFTTEPNSLMEMIPPPNILNRVKGELTGSSSMKNVLPDGSLSNTPWRKAGVKYTTNEIYLDIIEEIDATVEPNGLTTNAEVRGEIHGLCKLSGMPDLSLTFNQPHIVDDVSFHPCVRYLRWEQNKVISFVPPDGQFKLMSYRVKGQLQIPIYVKPQISFNGTTGKVTVMVGSKTPGKLVEDVVITIPLSKAVSSTSLTSNIGQVRFDDMTKIVKWTIGKLPKEKSPILEGTITLTDPKSASEANLVVDADFKINMVTISGLKVDALTIFVEKYKPFKGVRSIAKAGKLHFRS